VALTRARDRLYVTGWQARGERRSAGDPCWHETVSAALADRPDVERFALELGRDYAGDAFRLRRGAPGSIPAAAAARAEPAVPLPAWARAPVADEAPPPRPLTPSRLAAASEEEPAPDSPAGDAARERVRRGVLVHRLLQVLPELPEARRREAGRRLLERAATAADRGLDEAGRERLLDETMAVLALPALAPAFAAGSRAEQPLCGELGGRPFAGQIDRLAVTADAVLVVDYKTGRRPPDRVEAAPVAYLRQMAAYRALLGKVYPGRQVRAALLWTQGPRLDVLPDHVLDSHAPVEGLPPA
jgi:ATP-dependent helicase/nuclease subunit A